MEFYHWKNGQIHFGEYSTQALIKKYGSPLYIYDENTIRTRCKQLIALCPLPNFRVYYSAKANTSVAILKIIKDEGLKVDAMSPGEIFLEKQAGFESKDILFVSNNVSKEGFLEVIDHDVKVCLDSISQMETYFKINPKSEVIIRLNLGGGAGHHQKVVTAGKVKFGIEKDRIDSAFKVADKYQAKITGFHVHIGSFFLQGDAYLESVANLLKLAEKYPSINYLDFGGGFGVPYDRLTQKEFPLDDFSKSFTKLVSNWSKKNNRNPTFAIEPGRFVTAESGVCLTGVNAVKTNSDVKFIGTDLGFNLFLRPEMYGAYHEIINATNQDLSITEKQSVVGNICESGDYLGQDRDLPLTKEKDIMLIRDTGAYGFSMSGNYNSIKRPAELLLDSSGKIKLIRKRETDQDLLKNQIF